MKSGFIALIGRPNAGKSTLINSLLQRKVAIATHKAQTTRNSILGILNREDLQLVFIDTPGIHEATSYLGSYMNKEAYAQADGADIIFYVVDAVKGLGRADKEVLEKLFAYDIPIFCVFNKIDELSNEKLIDRCQFAATHYDFKEIVPISALESNNIEELIKTSLDYLNDGVLYYPTDTEEVRSNDFKISEIIREKIILFTEKEVPHLTAVKIDTLKETDSKVTIEASIIVNKQSHKGIIIGKQGAMLKKINMSACKDIKALLGKKVLLSLYVKVEEDWLNSSKKLFDLGYFNE
ncbi:MAG: GTPase Era [Erysipelotrichaceae bacterium]|nr:GTPase Era [Erysipelotrichaceae bacterium]